MLMMDPATLRRALEQLEQAFGLSALATPKA